jgi:hypothetical protein
VLFRSEIDGDYRQGVELVMAFIGPERTKRAEN